MDESLKLPTSFCELPLSLFELPPSPEATADKMVDKSLKFPPSHETSSDKTVDKMADRPQVETRNVGSAFMGG